MAYEGMLANALVTGVAAGAYLYVAIELVRRQAADARRRAAAAALFGIIGIHLTFAGLRQLVSFVGAVDPGIARLEEPTFYAAAIPAALAIVPLAYMATWALTGNERMSRVTMTGFLIVVFVGVFFIFAEGIEGPHRSFWGSEWTINSIVTKVLLLLFVTLPAFGAGIVLLHAGRRGTDDPARRARLVGWSVLIYYAAFTLDALGIEGAWLLAERAAMAFAALLGYWAYFRASVPTPTAQPALH